MRLSVTSFVLLCGALLAAPAAPAKPAVKEDRYLAWFEASITDARSTSSFTSQPNCSGTNTLTSTLNLTLRSTQPSILILRRQGKALISFHGTLLGMTGSFRHNIVGNYPCPPQLPPGVVPLSGLPVFPPLEVSDATLDVAADPERPLAFSPLQYTSANVRPARTGGPACCHENISSLAAELVHASGSLSSAQLHEAKVEDASTSGSFVGDLPPRGWPTRSLAVTWKLTIRAIFDKHATRIE